MSLSAFRLPLAALAFTLLAGCDEGVDPTLGTDQAFTVYGYLDPTASQQALRVIPIAPRIDSDVTEIDAVVTATDVASGETVTWRDSLVTYDEGTPQQRQGHVFVADWTPEPDHRYRITVRRTEDGKEATVEVTVPRLRPATVSVPEAASGDVFYPVRVSGVPRVLGGTLKVTVLGEPGAGTDTTVLEIPADVEPVETSPGQWQVNVPFVTAVRDYLNQRMIPRGQLTLVRATYEAFVTDPGWIVPPGGFDPDVIVEPGTFSNIEGGFGFVGAGYATSVSWMPSIATLSRAGFAVSGNPVSSLRLNEVSTGAGAWVELYNPTAETVEISGYYITNDPLMPLLQRIPDGSLVPPQGFLVVETDFPIQVGDRIAVTASGGAEALSLTVGQVAFGATYGSFPDGRSLQLPQGGPNLFRGPLVSTPGEPNQLDSSARAAAINEINASGGMGWVEILIPARFDVLNVWVSTDADRVYSVSSTATGGAPRITVGEGGSFFDLAQTGGEVYVLAEWRLAPDLPYQLRVVDVRTYGPQAASESAGYLPDGPGGAWQDGLTPTRNAPNASGQPFN